MTKFSNSVFSNPIPRRLHSRRTSWLGVGRSGPKPQTWSFLTFLKKTGLFCWPYQFFRAFADPSLKMSIWSRSGAVWNHSRAVLNRLESFGAVPKPLQNWVGFVSEEKIRAFWLFFGAFWKKKVLVRFEIFGTRKIKIWYFFGPPIWQPCKTLSSQSNAKLFPD